MTKFWFIVIVVNILTNIYADLEHIVVKGDTLWDIAGHYYNDNFLWPKIYQFNKDKIRNPHLIYPGQVFVIPSKDKIVDISSSTLQKETQQSVETVSEKMQIVYTQQHEQENQQTLQSQEVEPQAVIKQETQLFVKTFNLKEKEIIAEIISTKENKILCIDGDIVYCKMLTKYDLRVNDVLGIYHIGPSKYDISLRNVKKNQLTYIGRLKVKEIKENGIFVGEIKRVYSPVTLKDVLIAPQ